MVDLEEGMPLVVSARTGLVAKDDAISTRAPTTYLDSTVRQVLEYITTHEISIDDKSLADSVISIVNGRQSLIMINGRKAALNDRAGSYAVVRNHKTPDGFDKPYNELEIEVSAVEQGGRTYKILSR